MAIAEIDLPDVTAGGIGLIGHDGRAPSSRGLCSARRSRSGRCERPLAADRSQVRASLSSGITAIGGTLPDILDS